MLKLCRTIGIELDTSSEEENVSEMIGHFVSFVDYVSSEDAGDRAVESKVRFEYRKEEKTGC